MLPLVAVANSIINTYLDSLKRDLSNDGFETIILILSIALISSPVFLLVLLGLGKFHMPVDPTFYLLWFGLTLLTVVEFIMYIWGLTRTRFLAANTFQSLAFVMTTLYAVLILRESIVTLQIVAVAIGLLGAILFFDWKSLLNSRSGESNNSGLLMVLLSIFLLPFGSIMYKSAALHTSSYEEFLTGRLVMDFVYYSIFFGGLFIFWYKKNPFPKLASFVSSWTGGVFMIGSALVELVGSYLFFKLPVPLLTILGTISIPSGYFIGHIKYKEHINARYIFGAILIVIAVIVFVGTGGDLGSV